MTTTTRHTNPQAEFSRLFCLAAAVILNDMPPANESAEEQQQRMETIARIIAADERTKALRSDPNADAIYKDEDTIISSAVADQKPAMWFNKSVNPAYQAGLVSADGNSLREWVYGRTEEHCPDCERLNGQKHR